MRRNRRNRRKRRYSDRWRP